MSKHQKGYMLKLNNNTDIEQVYFQPIYHGYSGEQNEEMNMVLYGCLEGNDDGGCIIGDEMVLIMSNSRHPQTLQLYKSAQVIEDEACIDILHFNALDTYSVCGDEFVDEDQKLKHAKIGEDNEFVDVECRVENIRPNPNKIDRFFKEPRVLTVVAYIDTVLSGEQIAHISCRYSSENRAECEWIRQDTCFKTNLTQKIDGNQMEIKSTILKLNGTEENIDWSGFVLWENGDEYISMYCGAVGDDGACDAVRVYVWSDEDHMDQPTINEIYRQLQSVCVDPTDLIFLNTFHECIIPSPVPILERCSTPNGWSPITLSMLHGVWYIAADLNADSKMFLQSSVIDMQMRNDSSGSLDLTYYAQKESDGRCIGPGKGLAQLQNNGELHVNIEYTYSFVPGYKSNFTMKFQVLYLDNQRAVLYWCFKYSEAGKCTQHDVTFMIRSRHFSHNDMSMILPYLDKVCINKKDLRWFDLHSSCGAEISSSTILRRDLITLSHYHVLDILTNVQEPKCKYSEIRGVKADLLSLERAGTWFLMSRMDEMSMDTYAMVGRIFSVTNSTAVLRLLQSAALPGEHLECFTRVFTIRQMSNGTYDYWYELHFESTTKNSTFMIFRFLFYNRNVGVIYSCLRNAKDGRCDEKAIYVISRHESIDHAELTVLEKVAKSVCVEPTVLYHVAAHDECIFEHSRLKPPACSSVEIHNSQAEWVEMNLKQMQATYGNVVYQAVASSTSTSTRQKMPFAMRFDGQRFQKITEQNGGCLSSPITSIRFSARNRHLIHLVDDDVIILIHPAGVRSDLLLREAQMTGVLPCLLPIPVEPGLSCSQLITPSCQLPSKILDESQLNGEWFLYASDPMFVLNYRCTFSDGDDVGIHNFECYSESWVGECERQTSGRIHLNVTNGTFVSEFEDPIRTPEAEIFNTGYISIDNDRIILINDKHLVGLAYSLWVRKNDGVELSEKMRIDVGRYCVWPVESQIRHTTMLC